MAEVRIDRAGAGDVEELAPLFSAYRRFYEHEPEPRAERAFLRDRLERDEAVVFLARVSGVSGGGEGAPRAAGFTLLYPLFGSVSLRPVWLLNDLYVEPWARGAGAGRALTERAAEFARSTGAARIELRTRHTNLPARRLYERLGWSLDKSFRRYTLGLGPR